MEYFSGSKKLLLFILEDWKLLLFLTTLFALYFYYTKNFDFFEKKGIPYKKPVIFLGNLGPRLRGTQSFHDFQLEAYNYFKGNRYGGLFEGRRPILSLLDPDLIKVVMIRDFDHFTDRISLNSKEPKFWSRSLLNLKGAEWKGVRSTLTPVFSSSRLRNMLPLIQYCSNQMVDFLKQYDKKDVEMKKTIGHFTLEVIGTCAFGIKSDSLTDENAHFFTVAEKYDYMPLHKRLLLFFFLIFMPQLIKFLNFSFLNLDSAKEMVRILKAAKAERRKSGAKQNDFLQILIDFSDKEKSESGKTKADIHLDDDTIDAQCLLFLIAGYETSSTLLSFAIHVMATKPELQEKLRAHIKEMTEGKEVDYDLLAQLHYLEGFLLETLRVYPPLARVDRVCTKPYVIPGTNITLSPGNVVAIPLYGIHMDPEYYPEPQEFRPERFMNEDKKDRASHLYLAFGAGPRNCIGLRFAMLSAKLAMVELLKNFKFSACEKTVDPIQFDKRSLLLKAQGGLWVHIESL
ncbi:cytochrome P450 9e2-like [Trichoplusia ni]|uniref:unspecific monooxygenase n=1 Tax=Trichoplusia ni TaxID=7111 RepID=A0A7E5W3B3_TRINI|nr:cytochrome P450 9e2-like [Trichoplusia ni]